MKNQNNRYNVNDITRETFYQLPKVFFSKHSKYEKMTLNAAVAFSFLKDRFKYSIKNNWIDENGDIYFIFTNQELGETLKVKSKQTVVKIKKELEAYGLLEQKRMGVNQPNRLYLLQPEVTATDVYEIHHAEAEEAPQTLASSGSPKNELPERASQTLASSGSPKNGLPEKTPQTLVSSGSPFFGHNQYKESFEDTKKIQNDTQLDFSSNNYSQEETSQQNTDLRNHITEIMDVKANTNFISNSALILIKSWCQTPKQINRFIQIILNAKNSVVKDMNNQGIDHSYLLSLENSDLQTELIKWLRSYFNRIRANEENPKKRVKNVESYLYSTMYNGFANYTHSALQHEQKSNQNN